MDEASSRNIITNYILRPSFEPQLRSCRAAMESDLDHINASQLAEVSDVTQLALQDTVPWYRKRNLRMLYLTLVPSALGVEMTSGYDGSVLNGLQAVKPWLDCGYTVTSCYTVQAS